ncbi:hypothetical protein GCM10023152_28640 [Agromyces bauzanensis]|uniref:Uncharacterized protein n=1 Tax=Agromyces bauzanensis TaxID=1308924 RepID=A0A917PJY3_9MICO|nr:hypothetical protein GCM10011372_20340 [Agromyces bauzanensis]
MLRAFPGRGRGQPWADGTGRSIHSFRRASCTPSSRAIARRISGAKSVVIPDLATPGPDAVRYVPDPEAAFR